MENKIKINAEAFEKLLSIEYYFCLAYKGKGFEVRVRFAEEDFHHLEGIGQLKDLKIHSESGNITFEKALDGHITEDQLQKSLFFDKSFVKNKVDYLHLLERTFDENKLIFRLRKDPKGKSRIESELFLQTEVDNEQIFVYLDSVDGSDSEYFCRSFVANPDFDRNKKRQTAYGYRTKDMHIRLTEAELLKLQALADDFEMTESEFIRWSVFQRKVTMRIIIDDEKHALAQIRHQLDRIGNNINQIAKLVNTGYVNPEMFRTELKDMFKLIHDEIDLLNRVQSEVDEHWKNKVSKYSAYYSFDKTVMSQKFNGFY